MSIFLSNNRTCNQKANNFYSVDLERPDDATDEPVSLTEAKTHLIVTFDDDNTKITDLIKQCIEAVEQYTNTCILEQTVFVLADIIKEFELPKGPIVEFTSAELKTGVNVYAALTVNEQFEIDSDLQFARFVPMTYGRMKLTYTAGYGNDIPPTLKLAVLNEIAYRYEHRGDETNVYANQKVGLCAAAEVLAQPFKRMSWI